MKKIIVNITTLVGISGNAEHYYAKVKEIETPKNIYELVSDIPIGKWEEFYRTLETQEECDALTKKDGKGAYKHRIGNETSRFNSITQIKEWIDISYPKNDIAFLFENDLLLENNDIIERNPAPIKNTGKKIKIQNFQGFSSEFVNLTEGSIHEVIETPDRYKDKELQKGVWVMGAT